MANPHPTLPPVSQPPHSFPAQQPPIALDSTWKPLDNPRAFFVVGRAFRAKLPQPAGFGVAGNKFTTKDAFGDDIFTRPRIYIVLEEHEYYCIVITISMYGGRGVGKGLLDPSTHAVGYTREKDAFLLPEENRSDHRKMLATQICIIPDNPNDPKCHLDPGSRIDFGRKFTVDHREKAKGLGFVAPSSMRDLRECYSIVSREGQQWGPESAFSTNEHHGHGAHSNLSNIHTHTVAYTYIEGGLMQSGTEHRELVPSELSLSGDSRKGERFRSIVASGTRLLIPTEHKYIWNDRGYQEMGHPSKCPL